MTMVKKAFLFGILILVFGMTVISCLKGTSKVDTALNGTWVGTIEEIEFEYKFRNGNFENSVAGLQQKGTYTTENSKISFNYTHINGDGWEEFCKQIGLDFDWGLKSKWYTLNEFILAVKPQFLELGLSDKEVNELVGQIISSLPSINYSVDNKSLILKMEDETIILLKK